MSARKVLDAYSLVVFLENGPGADKIAEMIKQARDKEKPLYLSVVSWGEAYATLKKSAGETSAEKGLAVIETLPIELIAVDKEIAKAAAEICSMRGVSFLDAIAAATAKAKRAQLVTGLHTMKALKDSASILWIDQ